MIHIPGTTTPAEACGSARTGAEQWDRQFSAGEWSWLRGLDELAHHGVVAAYIRYGAPAEAASVLDVGCGEGLLYELLPDSCVYLGLDWSGVAIARARDRYGAETAFAVADAQSYVPSRRYDAIVFSECLYYFADPIRTLQAYATSLEPEGFLIVSTYVQQDNAGIWQGIEANFDVLDRLRITHSKGTGWDVGMMRGKTRG